MNLKVVLYRLLVIMRHYGNRQFGNEK